jgi:hypothetical protein
MICKYIHTEGSRGPGTLLRPSQYLGDHDAGRGCDLHDGDRRRPSVAAGRLPTRATWPPIKGTATALQIER